MLKFGNYLFGISRICFKYLIILNRIFIKMFSSKSNNNRITITTRIVDVVVVIVHAFWFDFAINNRSYESSTIIIIFSVLFCLNNYICVYRIVLVFSYLSDKYYTLSSRFSSCNLMCHFISI